jgi:hypothetical protein
LFEPASLAEGRLVALRCVIGCHRDGPVTCLRLIVKTTHAWYAEGCLASLTVIKREAIIQ